MTHNAVQLILDAFACFRLTKLITTDEITRPLRERIVGAMPSREVGLNGLRGTVPQRMKLATFITCPWCVGMWAAFFVTACQALIPTVWQYGAVALTLAAAAGLLSLIAERI